MFLQDLVGHTVAVLQRSGRPIHPFGTFRVGPLPDGLLKALLFLQVAGGGIGNDKRDFLVISTLHQSDALRHAVAFIHQHPLDVGQRQIAVGHRHRDVRQVLLNGLLHRRTLEGGADHQQPVNLPLGQTVDGLHLALVGDAGVDDEAGVPGAGQLLLHKKGNVHIVGIADVGDEDADHPAGTFHQPACGLVGGVAALLQQLLNFPAGLRLDARLVVHHTGYGTGRNAGFFRNIVNGHGPSASFPTGSLWEL